MSRIAWRRVLVRDRRESGIGRSASAGGGCIESIAAVTVLKARHIAVLLRREDEPAAVECRPACGKRRLERRIDLPQKNDGWRT